jgi:hypothetical protein
MATKFSGYKRVTHGFTDGWKSEAEHAHIGEFKELGSNRVSYSDNGESADRRITFVAPRGTSSKDAIAVIRNHLSFGCRCEHDCCGHTQGYATDVRRTKGRRFSAVLHTYINV